MRTKYAATDYRYVGRYPFILRPLKGLLLLIYFYVKYKSGVICISLVHASITFPRWDAVFVRTLCIMYLPPYHDVFRCFLTIIRSTLSLLNSSKLIVRVVIYYVVRGCAVFLCGGGIKYVTSSAWCCYTYSNGRQGCLRGIVVTLVGE